MKSQRIRLLEALKANGPMGVNSYDATYNMKIKQSPTRIFELRNEGWDISSITQKDRSTLWILNYTPPKQPEFLFTKDGRAIQI